MTERGYLAAELALRLLDGEELMAARRLAASDPDFAAEVATWEERLAPLLDFISEQTPSADAWKRIERRLDVRNDGTVVVLRQRVARWRAGALAAAAVAAVLLFVDLAPSGRAPVAPPTPAQPTRTAPLLVASLAGEEAPEALTVAFRLDTDELVVNPARIAEPTGRARELWLIPAAAGAQPISLGLVSAKGVQRRRLPADLARRFVPAATIAISDEPAGGSPTGQPTGAVLATGNLAAI